MPVRLIFIIWDCNRKYSVNEYNWYKPDIVFHAMTAFIDMWSNMGINRPFDFIFALIRTNDTRKSIKNVRKSVYCRCNAENMTDVTIAEMQILSLNQNLKELKRHPEIQSLHIQEQEVQKKIYLIHKMAPEKDICEIIHSSIFLPAKADKGQITE